MKQFFESFQLLSPSELDELVRHIQKRIIKKDEFLIKEGKICEEMMFVKSGIFRAFYSTEKGEEITYCLAFPGMVVTALSSFISGQPTQENFQAITDIELEVLPKSVMEKWYDTSANWLKVNKLLMEEEYMKLEKRAISLQKEGAKQRYEAMMLAYPKEINYVPLLFLASYLGVTPRHLSRLRKEFAH